MSRITEALRRADATVANEPAEQKPSTVGPLNDSRASFTESPVTSPPGTFLDLPIHPRHGSAPMSAMDEGEAPAWTVPTDDEERPMAVFQGFDPKLAEKLVVGADSHASSWVEQYRKLAAGLHHAQVERGIKVVMFASAVTGEGKSLTATNLALTLGESYRRRVLLVDGDLRHPTLHDVFQVPNVSGLNDGLRAETDQKLSLIQISSNLSLLTAGRPEPDPMSGLISNRMRRMIREASAAFDWVIIDTPPVGLLPDGNLLADMVDVVVLVIAAGKTPFGLIHRAVQAIGRDRVFGVVLNRIGERAPTADYDYQVSYGKYVQPAAPA